MKSGTLRTSEDTDATVQALQAENAQLKVSVQAQAPRPVDAGQQGGAAAAAVAQPAAAAAGLHQDLHWDPAKTDRGLTLSNENKKVENAHAHREPSLRRPSKSCVVARRASAFDITCNPPVWWAS